MDQKADRQIMTSFNIVWDVVVSAPLLWPPAPFPNHQTTECLESRLRLPLFF